MVTPTSGSSDEPSDSPLALGLGFWLAWVLASMAGWAAGAAIAAVGSYPDIIVGGTVRLALGGILLGGLQSLVLRGHLARAGRWALANIAAVGAVGVVIFGVGLVSADVGWVVGAALFGTVLGVLQWLVLGRQRARAGWWVLASTVGWVAAMAVGALAALDLMVAENPLPGWAALGAVYGAVTGPVLVWLLRQRPPGAVTN